MSKDLDKQKHHEKHDAGSVGLSDLLVRELQHWKEVRYKYSFDNNLEELINENKRCAVDIIKVLSDLGIKVDKTLAH